MAVVDVIASSYLEIQPGLELLDNNNVLIEDISNDLESGTISHSFTDSIAGTATLRIERNIQWHNQRLRPYLTIRDSLEEYTYNMGVYLPTTPNRVSGDSPQIYEAECYDVTSVLDTPIGSTYEVAADSDYLQEIESIFTSLGISDYSIDQTKAGDLTPTLMVWPLDERNTYLKVINDLLLGINYEFIYSDRNGTLQCIPWNFPQDKAAIWTYSTESDITIVTEGGTAESDLYEIPNKWVFINDDPAKAAFPTEGDGIYTVNNINDGVTSQTQRGRTITSIHRVSGIHCDDCLIAFGDLTVQREKKPTEAVSVSVGPNPLHFHYDVVALNAPELGFAGEKFVVDEWSLPLDGSDMSLELSKVF